MITGLNNLPLVEGVDDVGILDGGQAMGDHDGCTTLRCLAIQIEIMEFINLI